MNRIKLIFTYLFISSFLQVYASETNEQTKETIGIDFFTKVKRISNLKVDKDNIFFILSQPNLEENRYNQALYQLIDGEAVKLSENVSDYFIQEGKIIFKDTRKESDKEKIKAGEPLTVFQSLSSGYQEAEEWLRLPFTTNQIEWIDKEHFFYTTTYDHHLEQLTETCNGDRKVALKKKEEDKGVRIFDELPFWSNGRGDVSGLRTHLYYYQKGETTLLSDKFASVSSLGLSPDKKTLIYTERPASYGKVPQGNLLCTLNTQTLEKKTYPLFEKASYTNMEFINNQEVLLTINRGQEREKIENAGIYRLNLSTGEIKEIYDGSLYGFGNSIGTDIGGSGKITFTTDKEGFQYVSTVRDYAPLLRFTYKNNQITPLTREGICVQEYIPYKDGFLIVALVEQQGSEIYFLNKKGELSRLSSINKEVFDTHEVIKPIEIFFTNEEGKELNGYVIPPAGYEKGKKYPAILDIHGGPKTAYGTVFVHEMQYWANEGYAVFFTNPTGSDGRGSEFSNIRGRKGEIDYSDLMHFVDAVVEQIDFIDKERLGVTGGSYGGFMTNWIIGHTDRFKAAASQRSISSWISFSNTSDIGHNFTHNYFGTDAWNNQELLWERSPLKYANNVTTPTLLIHSEEDYRCWLVEGIQMYYALQYFEVPTRIAVFKNENHELSRSGKPQNRVKRLSEITNWFNTYLK